MSTSKTKSFIFTGFLFCVLFVSAQKSNKKNLVYDPELNQLVSEKHQPLQRKLRYTPDGEDFVIVNGTKKFNRALYGTHSGFRVETSDVPEFALYLPHMGGNLSFFIGNGKSTISLNKAKRIECRYRPGSRIYLITDPLLNNGSVRITALAMSRAEGLILKIETYNIPAGIKLSWLFGGCADKRFSRDGDMGVDPDDCFDLKPEYCVGNKFSIDKNTFQVAFGSKMDKKLAGVFPLNSQLKTNNFPALEGKMEVQKNQAFYLSIQVPQNEINSDYNNISHLFESSEAARVKLTSQFMINTPDPYFNTLGSTLAVAADGIWNGEVWLHGAVGWRMPLTGWRAAYVGDALGWHDRARSHFNAYAASQVTDVEPTIPHPNQDKKQNLSRAEEKWGTQMYSNGYICRNPNDNTKMHHYDMNLVYIDELLWHLNWTGDLDYARKIWPTLVRHLAWEKRNHDPDNDGLYDAYCCIWASDGLYYNSGAVTHASAYNYRANKMAAEIARKIGEDPEPYQNEADKILKALNSRLWLTSEGHWAEFQDFMGNKLLHKDAALWTIYHAIDSETADPFQAYEATRYVDTEIPHIPVVAKGLKDEGYATVSTTNWMPYCWSTNNVVFAEVMHTALSYWQTGRNEEAFKLLKSSVLDGMYLGGSPGNIGQISYYDAARGESYRDFGDPIGVLSRDLVQGLFGIIPDAMNGKLTLRPGFPSSWDHASVETPDIQFIFFRKNKTDHYIIKQHFNKKLSVFLDVRAETDSIGAVLVDHQPASWSLFPAASGFPMIRIAIPAVDSVSVKILWKGDSLKNRYSEQAVEGNSNLIFKTTATITQFFDPQKIWVQPLISNHKVTGVIKQVAGHHTFFVKLSQKQMQWWQPINVEVKEEKKSQPAAFSTVNSATCETINIDNLFNDSVTQIFKNLYLSPRSPYTSLEIPTQGIGEWCHPKETAEIDDSGLRKSVRNSLFQTKLGVPFRSVASGKNIAFTSLWDNFPSKIVIPLNGSATNVYLLMAGTTNQMQSHFTNGIIIAGYADGTADTLKLVNPENWCPIEQDYFADGKAFRLDAPRPYRLVLKTGLISNNLEKELNINGVYGRRIPGGACILLDMPLDKNKELSYLKIKTIANEVIIGLMSLTLQR
jgi:hypothetical protein